MSQPAPAPAKSEIESARKRARDDALTFAVCYAAVLLAATVVVVVAPGSWKLVWLQAEWWLWFLALQAICLLATLAWRGRPKTRTRRRRFLLLNGALAVAAALEGLQLLVPLLFLSLHLALRVAVAAAWTWMVLGLPFVIWEIVRQRTKSPRRFLLAKLWFSAAFSVVLFEPTAAWIERRQHEQLYRVQFPELLASPDEGELRIVAVGASTMAGTPYEPKFGIPAVVGWRLQQLFPDKTVVVENLAVEGENLRQALNHLKSLKVRPHLLLLYTGHNEFFHDVEELTAARPTWFEAVDRRLKRSPTFRTMHNWLAQRMALRTLNTWNQRSEFEQPIAAPQLYEVRLQRFRSQLESLAGFCREQRIRPLWFVPCANEAGFDPNRSVLPDDVTETEREQFRQILDAATMQRRLGRHDEALAVYRRGLAIHPRAAELHFGLAESLAATDRMAEAREHYQRAVDEDGHPIRANRDYRQAVADVARENEIPLLDAAEVLRLHTKHGILDQEVILDHVHPNLEGYYLLGLAAVDVILKENVLDTGVGHPVDAAEPSFEDAVSSAGVTNSDLIATYRRVADAFRWLMRWRFEGTFRQREAERFDRMADGLETGIIQPGQGGTDALP